MTSKGFEINNLPGYRVEYNARFRVWYVYVTGIKSFSWNDATERHDIPSIVTDYSIEQRKTAKAAVACAYAHARRIAEYQAQLG